MKPALALFVLAAVPAAAQDDIAAQRARLAQLTSRVDAAAGRPFVINRRIHVDMNARVFTVWLAAIAPNGVRATATGTRAEGNLVSVQRPIIGTLRAAIDPASATRLDLTLANTRINAAANRLTINGNLRGDARAQVRVTGTGMNQTVACTTDPAVREPGVATFELGTSSGSRYPYTLRLTTPNDLRAGLTCDIGELRRIENVLPINSLAGNLSTGTIDIGLSPDIRLLTPGVGRPMVVPLNPRRPSLRVTPQGLAYSAD
jgi:hypothetical protein